MDELTLLSPNGHLRALVQTRTGGVFYTLLRDEKILVESSPIGLLLDGENLARNAVFGAVSRDSLDETYTTRGVHSLAHNRCETLAVEMENWRLEARIFDDGFAFRSVVVGGGTRQIDGEISAFTLPPKSRIWFAERPNDWKLKSYAGWGMRCDAEELPTISSQGPIQVSPLIVELEDGEFLALTEAALFNFSGMRFRATGNRRLQADFHEGQAGFSLTAPFSTPWRVVLCARNLDELVNSDVLTNLCPPPDSQLFADTSWIETGRSVWRWWSAGTGTPGQERQMIEWAAQLGYEFSLVDDGWKEWEKPWDELTAICALGRQKGVKILVWKDYNDFPAFPNPERALLEWLDAVQNAGVAGVKMDFFNCESLHHIRFQERVWHETAQRRLLIFFHGCHKPTSEERTWPHEVTREGIRGLELNKMREGPIRPGHNAALPFTRFVAGHGDYTPVGFSNPGPTTWAHQLATSIVFTSPLQVIAENPEFLLQNPTVAPVLDVLRALPTGWDETRVLEPSQIGELAMFARRKDKTWFLAAISGENPVQTPPLDLSFLPARGVLSLICNAGGNSFSRHEGRLEDGFSLALNLEAGDGLVAVARGE